MDIIRYWKMSSSERSDFYAIFYIRLSGTRWLGEPFSPNLQRIIHEYSVAISASLATLSHVTISSRHPSRLNFQNHNMCVALTRNPSQFKG